MVARVEGGQVLPPTLIFAHGLGAFGFDDAGFAGLLAVAPK